MDLIKFDGNDTVYDDYYMRGIFQMTVWLRTKANSLDSDHHTKISCYFDSDIDYFHNEISNLQKLTERGCDFAPKYISSRIVVSGTYTTKKHNNVLSFSITEIVMEKIKGVTVKELIGCEIGSHFPKSIPDKYIGLRSEIERVYYQLEHIYNIKYSDKHSGNVMVDDNGYVFVIDFEV